MGHFVNNNDSAAGELGFTQHGRGFDRVDPPNPPDSQSIQPCTTQSFLFIAEN
jgi:hypothetical protein